jgi:ADP-ribose pyrophosphatase YjhB (NUDIX family)
MEAEIRIPSVGSAVVVTKDDRVLLGRRNKKNAFGKWVLPGGRVGWGETIADAAVREAKEETGLDVGIKKLICHKEIIATHADYHRVVFFHLAEAKNDKIVVGDDLSEAGFFTIDEIKGMDILESVELVLREAGFWK